MTKQTIEHYLQSTLKKLTALGSARRGQLSIQYYTKKAADGRSHKQGPYYVWQRSINGRKHSVRVPAEHVDQIKADLARGQKVQAVFDQLWELMEQAAIGRDADVKKKEQVVRDARLRETDEVLNHLRQSLSSGKPLDMACVERLLRQAVLQDMARLWEGFLNDELPRLLGPLPLRNGEKCHSVQSREVCSIFGQVQLRRFYYYGPQGGRYPLDEILGLHRCYTPAVTQLMCWTGAMEGSFDQASETLRRCAGLTIPGRQIQRVVNDCGPEAARWMDQRPAPSRPTPVEVLNIQTDMTGIPARPEELEGIKGKQPDGSAKSRQIKIGCVFTQTRNADGTIDRDPASTTYLTAFCDPVDFGLRLRGEALKRGAASARATVFLGDGAEWIWAIAQDCFPEAVQIVDFFHACEHLHALCLTLEPDPARAKTLFDKWRKTLKKKGLARVLHQVTNRIATTNDALRLNINGQLDYFRKNAHRMDYPSFQKKGFFIGSGVVEGSCRHVVAQRTKLSGMRWLLSGAENVLHFRSVIKSNLYDDYCAPLKRAA